MSRMQQSTPTRRTVLSAIGTGIAAGVVGTAANATRSSGSEYALVQGDRCVPVQPIRGREPVETFYEYRLPKRYVGDDNGASVGDAALYSSAGTTDLQRARTSIAFLYRGPEGLSLVVVHGSLDAADGGAVTFRLSGVPEAAEWVVTDDRYRDPATGALAPTNYDRWRVDGTEHRIDWTWGSGGTDGGALRGFGGDFEVVVEPAFNRAAALYDEHYEGTVTDWEFLSGAAGDPTRIPLDMGEPIRLATGGCPADAPPGPIDGQTDRKDQETTETGRPDDVRATDRDDADEHADDAAEAKPDDEEPDEDDSDDAEELEEDESEDERSEEDDSNDEGSAEDEGSEEAESVAADDEEGTVCHRPPGNPDNAHTIRVGSESAVEAHLGHGDSLGPCTGDE